MLIQAHIPILMDTVCTSICLMYIFLLVWAESMPKNVPPLCGSGALYIHEAFAFPAKTSASGLDGLSGSRMLE